MVASRRKDMDVIALDDALTDLGKIDPRQSRRGTPLLCWPLPRGNFPGHGNRSRHRPTRLDGRPRLAPSRDVQEIHLFEPRCRANKSRALTDYGVVARNSPSALSWNPDKRIRPPHTRVWNTPNAPSRLLNFSAVAYPLLFTALRSEFSDFAEQRCVCVSTIYHAKQCALFRVPDYAERPGYPLRLARNCCSKRDGARKSLGIVSEYREAALRCALKIVEEAGNWSRADISGTRNNQLLLSTWRSIWRAP
jgi:hypothetical protein